MRSFTPKRPPTATPLRRQPTLPTLGRLERRVAIWQKERILLGRALGFRPGQQTLQCLNQGH
jgi:hypothetical protein